MIGRIAAVLLFLLTYSGTARALAAHCGTHITLSSTRSSNQENSCIHLAGVAEEYECPTLQTALDFVKETWNSSNCTEIQLSPSVKHSLKKPVAINASVLITSSDRQAAAVIIVEINVDAYFSSNDYDPLYILNFERAQYVGMERIEISGSPGIIGISNVDLVEIENCSFRYFVQGAVDIYECSTVSVLKSIFEHNGPVSNILKMQPFRGNSGGLSIGYNNVTSPNTELSVSIERSTFINNSAIPTPQLQTTSSTVISHNIFSGRGGALGLLLSNEKQHVEVVVRECHFSSNNAGTFGGGVYVIFDFNSSHNVTILRCMFGNNASPSSAGAVFVAFFGPGTASQHSVQIVTDCEFFENTAVQGGAAVAILSGSPEIDFPMTHNYARYHNCTFVNNEATQFAAALALVTSFQLTFGPRTDETPFEISNCSFLNHGRGDTPALGIGYVPVNFEGHNIFQGGKGGAMLVAGSLVHIFGGIEFQNNNLVGSYNGALQIFSFGQVVMHRGSHLSFYNNTGSIGAALHVDSQDLSKVLSKLLYNPLCFLQYEDPRLPPDDWKDVEIRMDSNHAIVGSVGNINFLDLCSWNRNQVPFFDSTKVMKWDFVKLGDNENTFHNGDPGNQMWYVQSPPGSVEVVNKSIEVYPGQRFSIQVTAYDELKQPVGTFFRLLGISSNDKFQFTPAVQLYSKQTQQLETQVHIAQGTSASTQLISLSNFFDDKVYTDDFYIQLAPCPPGYTQVAVHTVGTNIQCTCNFGNTDIVFCKNSTVVFKKSLWASKDATKEDQLFVYPCPAGYCKCSTSVDESVQSCVYEFDSSFPNMQCSCERQGVLCGECKDINAVSILLNHCVTCSSEFALLFPLLVILDVIAILILCKVCPQFASIFPCLFYIQLLPYATESTIDGFLLAQPCLHYVGSAVSFYFVYDFCLYSKLNTVASYWIRFTPTAVVMATLLLIIAIAHKYSRVHKFFARVYSSVWSVLLLVYLHTVHTSISVLNCVRIPIDNHTESRWFVDGSVECFEGNHLPLALLAVMVLCLCLLLIPLSLLISVKKFRRWLLLKQLRLAANEGFVYKWWIPVEFSRRLILVLMIVPFPGNKNPVLFALCVSMVIFSYLHPYNSKLANRIEVFLAVDSLLVFLSAVPNTPSGTLAKTFVTFPSANSSSPCSSSLYVSPQVIFTTIFYYTPLLVLLVVLIAIATQYLWKKVRKIGYIKETEQKEVHSTTFDLDEESVLMNEVSTSYIEFSRKGSSQSIMIYNNSADSNL